MIMKPSIFLMSVLGVSILCGIAAAQDQAAPVPEASVSEPAVETPPAAEPVVSPESAVQETPVDADATSDEPSAEDAAAAAVPESPVIPLPALATDVPIEKEMLDQLLLRKPPIDIEKMPSLFLTVWERDLVINARKGQTARDPDAPEIVVTPEETPNPYESPRDLRLSGIVYRSSGDWVIWLNATRIAPKALPPEIMDIKVFKDYIELEWFDAQTNQIFPIRLRPHQRFNLDARIFLPG